MYIHQSRTQRWVHTKALLAFIIAISLTAGLLSIPLWVKAEPLHAHHSVHKTLTANAVIKTQVMPAKVVTQRL